MMTVTDMQKLMVQAMTGKPSGITGPEADKFLKDIEPDVRLAKRNGWELVVPKEWEVGVDGSEE
jgi:hypothetical protein